MTVVGGARPVALLDQAAMVGADLLELDAGVLGVGGC